MTNEERFHNQIGDEYDLFQLASPHHDELQNSVGSVIRDRFGTSKQTEIQILEIGFGTGITSKVILNSDQRVNLVGVDNEPLMFSKARHALNGLTARYNLQVKDALEFLSTQPDNSFDAVASAFVIHNFTVGYRGDVFKEILRVLKPNGIFINADKIVANDPIEHEANFKWQLSQFDVFDKIGKPELKIEWTQHYVEDEKPDRILIENDFQEC